MYSSGEVAMAREAEAAAAGAAMEHVASLASTLETITITRDPTLRYRLILLV